LLIMKKWVEANAALGVNLLGVQLLWRNVVGFHFHLCFLHANMDVQHSLCISSWWSCICEVNSLRLAGTMVFSIYCGVLFGETTCLGALNILTPWSASAHTDDPTLADVDSALLYKLSAALSGKVHPALLMEMIRQVRVSFVFFLPGEHKMASLGRRNCVRIRRAVHFIFSLT
jgi:hypothetical protein